MGSYVSASLISGEKIIHESKVSWWSMLPLVLLGFVFLGAFGIGLLFWLAAYIRYKSTEIAFTNKRVIAKFGFISRRTVELQLQKLESVQVDQGVLGRIFNYGTLVVSGAGNPQAPIPGISNPMEFKRVLIEYQDQQKHQ